MQSREAGQTLGGKYRLVSQLGQGGMGAVWRAEHLTLSSPVALKLIEPGTAKDPDGLQRFLREARTAAALRSPHVVQILDYGVDGDTPYIAMELLEGESLAERLSRVGRLSTRETARVIQHVARAISRAHEAGVVHRDLKPENVFIVSNDDEEMIKVLDFGIVKANPANLGSSAAPAATRTGTLLGTPYFMSPEQAAGEKSVDHRADIWALGVMAYKCVLGHLPFNGESVGKLILEICSQPLPIPSRVGKVPPGFDAWFGRACARDPAQRFSSAKQAAAEFARLDEDSSVESQPQPRVPPASNAEAVLGATTGHSTNSEVASRRARSGSSRWLLLAVGAAAAAGLVFWTATRRTETGAERDAASVDADQTRGNAAAQPAAEPVAGAPKAPPRADSTTVDRSSAETGAEPVAPPRADPTAAPATSASEIGKTAGPRPAAPPPAPQRKPPAAIKEDSRKSAPKASAPASTARGKIDLGI